MSSGIRKTSTQHQKKNRPLAGPIRVFKSTWSRSGRLTSLGRPPAVTRSAQPKWWASVAQLSIESSSARLTRSVTRDLCEGFGGKAPSSQLWPMAAFLWNWALVRKSSSRLDDSKWPGTASSRSSPAAVLVLGQASDRRTSVDDQDRREPTQTRHPTAETVNPRAVAGWCCSGETSRCAVPRRQGSALAPHARQPGLLLDR